MNQDHQWNLLSKHWQQQDIQIKYDKNLLIKRLFKHRLQKTVFILFDVIIIICAGYLFYYAFNNYYSLMDLIWIGFGVLFGSLIAIVSTVERLKKQHLINSSLKWIDYEISRAKSQIKLAQLAKYGVIVFGLFFHIWLIIGHIYDPNFIAFTETKDILTYIFSIAWMGLFWIVASRVQKAAKALKLYFSQEKNNFEM